VIQVVLFVLLVVTVACLPLAHWAYPPWRNQ